MRLSRGGSTALALAALLAACNTVDPDDCWPNTSGGFGGSGSIPIGAGVGVSSGDFSTPPRGPLTFPGGANPCVIAPTGCDAQCLANYEAAAAECGKMADQAQRKTCQDTAHAVYNSCEATCQQSSGDCVERCKQQCDSVHDKCHAACKKNDPTSTCHAKCNDQYGACLKQCDKNCKGT